ncbi:hypothetical protein A3A14_02440 [Candidatus Daviesbacteria bacterium RIFCSPLOWO2_01_FULL_43_38]|uniref:Type II toxin-antitoxin system mRNA interferase toxin, RelE/StbE family n=3 Tax=Candidatus Daviesiibacteriota TaxID=1752718 RepID=A0A1F5K1P1_9BACT|nr:MAG: hypothetical protein UV33_C0013G0009 [Candidatus Daviesbacteria bacterium GW2011_GWA1_42_6]KKS69620.1 MAG: hypothetical protein UV41_C0049G0002 [Candidatus Daviesbacteria bacterium GW2011_GWA2_42_7]OGE19106.1 MAG: hypothetical protein A2874_01845 [Candidatus Daviesbacteria bacterium RIFCSPHIGHO2_01_FULL_43_17]OGE34814.1 MAG: hypothetical protein A3E45_02460 [Candidatus Daviesbacteria bacterium RIFCSPHIGHO2_12_FULL_43_11]OGE64023.1 MAG: hypothetical protein A3A14_02440 [Candidatus Davies
MRVRFSRKFRKQYNKADGKVKSFFDKKLELFLRNSFDPQLNNHPLSGKLQGFRSINITGDWRALYSEQSSPKDDLVVIFEMLGTHSQLYK